MATKSMIEFKTGPGGRSAVIKGSRVRVSDIARLYELMRDELIVERINEALPHLTAEQIRAAVSYWRDNEPEIAAEIEEERLLFAELANR